MRPSLPLLWLLLGLSGCGGVVTLMDAPELEGEAPAPEELLEGVPDCIGPKDDDQDGVFAPCGEFTVEQPDCDDQDGDNWASCASCVDVDGDGAYAGCDAYSEREEDCDDARADVQECVTCVDQDGDGYVTGCPPTEEDPQDCDDTDPDNWTSCTRCVDADKDGFFVGCDVFTAREGPDCDDTNATKKEIIQGVCGGPPPAQPTPKVIRLKVGSFNIRSRSFDNKYPSHTWKSRLPSVKSYLRARAYDFFGFQEVWAGTVQYVDLRNAVPTTHALTSSATNIRRNAIAYDKTRFVLEAQGHFKLQGEASKYATWARFRDRPTGQRLFVLNAHLSAYEAKDRAAAAKKIVAELAKLNTGKVPVLLIGDFNSATKSAGAPWAIFKAAGYLDSMDVAATKQNPTYNTRHGFRAKPPKDSRRVDHVYVRGGVAKAKVNLARTDVEKPLGKYSSDHFPVMADVTLTY